MKTVTVSAQDAMKQVTATVEIKVTGTSIMRLRLWLGIRLINLAAFVIGCRINTSTRYSHG